MADAVSNVGIRCPGNFSMSDKNETKTLAALPPDITRAAFPSSTTAEFQGQALEGGKNTASQSKRLSEGLLPVYKDYLIALVLHLLSILPCGGRISL